MISIDPYIRASVREVQDTVGDGHRDDEDANGVVSSDVRERKHCNTVIQ